MNIKKLFSHFVHTNFLIFINEYKKIENNLIYTFQKDSKTDICQDDHNLRHHEPGRQDDRHDHIVGQDHHRASRARHRDQHRDCRTRPTQDEREEVGHHREPQDADLQREELSPGSAAPHLRGQAARGRAHSFGLQHPEGQHAAPRAAPACRHVSPELWRQWPLRPKGMIFIK